MLGRTIAGDGGKTALTGTGSLTNYMIMTKVCHDSCAWQSRNLVNLMNWSGGLRMFAFWNLRILDPVYRNMKMNDQSKNEFDQG